VNSEQAIGHHMLSLNEENIRALEITSWLTGIYFFIELGLGIYSGKIATHPSDKYRTFGSLRAEIIGALLSDFSFLQWQFLFFI